MPSHTVSEPHRTTDADYLDALALFARVGRDEDVSKELDELCWWRGLDRRVFEQRCAELKEAPGFVERSAVFYRIRPAIVAKTRLQHGVDEVDRWP